MALGTVSAQERFDNPRALLGDRLRGIYRLLADHGEVMFPHDYFADCYKDSARGRPTVPARVLATTMVLQAHEGLSDGEACDRLERDLAWQAAAGVHTGCEAFHPTVLVGMRNRLRASARPRRLFEDTRKAAVESGVLGNRVRVVDSTPVYDSVATQDTVTQLRSAIRKLLRALDQDHRDLAAQVRAALRRDDDYASAGKHLPDDPLAPNHHPAPRPGDVFSREVDRRLGTSDCSRGRGLESGDGRQVTDGPEVLTSVRPQQADAGLARQRALSLVGR